MNSRRNYLSYERSSDSSQPKGFATVHSPHRADPMNTFDHSKFDHAKHKIRIQHSSSSVHEQDGVQSERVKINITDNNINQEDLFQDNQSSKQSLSDDELQWEEYKDHPIPV